MRDSIRAQSKNLQTMERQEHPKNYFLLAQIGGECYTTDASSRSSPKRRRVQEASSFFSVWGRREAIFYQLHSNHGG